MNRITFLCLFSVILTTLLFTGCTKFVENGPSKVNAEALEWLPFQGNEVLVYKTAAGESMTILNNEKKTIFNSLEDCYDQGLKQICDRFLMEQVFVSGVESTRSLVISYTISHRVKEQKFYDVLEVLITHKSKPQINLPMVVFNDLEVTNTEITPPVFTPSMVLNGKSFQNVYHKAEGSKNIYYTKDKGVVAFNYDGEALWVLQ
ncbi:MAG: hypothetical protein K1X92_06605 [Bacteroidia bacterium]|nr:hypothetical protein [Bacteroidia bacterium]